MSLNYVVCVTTFFNFAITFSSIYFNKEGNSQNFIIFGGSHWESGTVLRAHSDLVQSLPPKPALSICMNNEQSTWHTVGSRY